MSSTFFTSLNGLKFHMQISDPDSIKFCKFHEFWRTLSKYENFIKFLRYCADGIFVIFLILYIIGVGTGGGGGCRGQTPAPINFVGGGGGGRIPFGPQ